MGIWFQCFSRCLTLFWEFDILVYNFGIDNHAYTLVSGKRRSKSTIVSPFQCMTRFGFSVTVATTTASIFSLLHSATKVSTSSGRTTTAIRSCDSEMAISVPFKPWYLRGTLLRSISRPSMRNWPIATQTPYPKVIGLLDQTSDAITEEAESCVLH